MTEKLDMGATRVDPSIEGRVHDLDVGLDETIAGPTLDDTLAAPDHLAETLVDTAPGAQEEDPQQDFRRKVRTTVLPRVTASQGGEQIDITFGERTRYEQVSTLGAGGMGQVYLVHDQDIERQVAMKRLKPKMRDKASLLRFVDEIKTIGQLEHPNIIPIHDVGVDNDGAFYFIMKHIDGEDLEHVIERLAAGDPDYHARFPFEERVRIFEEILQAMHFAHDHGIIHRDIKPANVMVGAHGEVIVMDWGLARPIGDPGEDMPAAREGDASAEVASGDSTLRSFKLTQRGQLLGTPAYMSPEQAEGRIDELDQRSDIFSLMMLFYELMVTRHPFEDRTSLVELIHAICNDDPEFPTFASQEHQEHVPAEYGHFIMKGLARDPDERYQSIDEVLRELHLVRTGKFAVQCPVTFSKRMLRRVEEFINRNVNVAVPLVIGSFVGALVILLLAIYGLISMVTA